LGQFHQHIHKAFSSKQDEKLFFGEWHSSNGKLIWQISPYILGKFYQQRMLVKLNGNLFTEDVQQRLFAWCTKGGEIDLLGLGCLCREKFKVEWERVLRLVR